MSACIFSISYISLWCVVPVAQPVGEERSWPGSQSVRDCTGSILINQNQVATTSRGPSCSLPVPFIPPPVFHTHTHTHTSLVCCILTGNAHSFNALTHKQKQDAVITLLCAFGEVGVGAKEDGGGHFHIHLAERCLSPFCTVAL